MKKWLLGLVIVSLCGAAFLYFNPHYLHVLERHSQDLLPDTLTHSRAYRWRDAHGQWQLSDQPPPKGIKYEVVEYNKNTNVIPSEQLTGKKPE